MAVEDWFDHDAEEFEERSAFRELQRSAFRALGRPDRHGAPWTSGEDRQLEALVATCATPIEISLAHRRTVAAVVSRMYALDIGENVYWVRRNRTEAGHRPFYQIPGPPAKMYVDIDDQKPINVTLFTLNKASDMSAQDNILLTLLQEGYTTVEVQFLGGGPTYCYTYKVTNEIAKSLKAGDQLVVPAGETCRLKVVTVKKVHEEPEIDVRAPYSLKWVVCKVDRTAYDEQLKRETEAIDLIKKAERKAAKRKAVETLLGGDRSVDGDVLDRVQRLLRGETREISE